MNFRKGRAGNGAALSLWEDIRAMVINSRSMILLPLFLAGCGSGISDDTGLSPGEASALNEAAAELDTQSLAPQEQDKGLNPAALSAASADRQRTAP